MKTADDRCHILHNTKRLHDNCIPKIIDINTHVIQGLHKIRVTQVEVSETGFMTLNKVDSKQKYCSNFRT